MADEEELDLSASASLYDQANKTQLTLWKIV